MKSRSSHAGDTLMLEQLFWLFGLSLPIACVSWTITHEEVVREPREWLAEHSQTAKTWWQRKFFYVWTCEYCFSHYVAAGFVALTGFQFLLMDWRGSVLSWLSLVAVSNAYTSAFSRLRLDIH